MPQFMLSSVITLIILGIFCRYSAAKTNATKEECKDKEFKCYHSGDCIRTGWLCDYNLDCPDWEDEGGMCIVMGGCPEGRVRCPKSREGCVKKDWLCDGVKECEDGSDENPPYCPQRDVPLPSFVCGINPLRSTDKVAGGSNTTIGDWPWMARIFGKDRTWFCGGVLINTEWVLSAAHCRNENDLYVRLGEANNNGNLSYPDDDDYKVLSDQVKVHPWYDANLKYNDIMLLKIPSIKNTISDLMRPICFPWKEDQGYPLEGQDAWVAGWGATSSGDSKVNTQLIEVELQIQNITACEEKYSITKNFNMTYPRGINENYFFCAAGKVGHDACNGDSGGPLVIKEESQENSPIFKLAGIVSVGIGCGKKEFPGLYIPVVNERDWIRKTALFDYN